MMGFKNRTRLVLLTTLWFGAILMGGCSLQKYGPTKPFPAPIPDQAKYTINFDAQGDFYFADSKGRTVPAEVVPFSMLFKKADLKKEGGFTPLGCYSLYIIKKNKRAWLCNDDFECVDGRMNTKESGAVFSLNYDGKTIFLGDASGKRVKRLKPLASLLANTDPDSLATIEALYPFTVNKILGSIKLSMCIDSRCYCVCYDPDTGSFNPCNQGSCD